MQLFAKLKKFLRSSFRATLNFRQWHRLKKSANLIFYEKKQEQNVAMASANGQKSETFEKCPLSVLTGVRNKRVNVRESIYKLFVGTNETVRTVVSGCPY